MHTKCIFSHLKTLKQIIKFLIAGNGRLKHPDGDYRDWSQKLWDINLTGANPYQNNFQMKNGRVEIIKPGLYFVYAQVRLYIITIF